MFINQFAGLRLRLLWLCCIWCFAGSLAGCTDTEQVASGPLNPAEPVTVTLWSYGGETLQVKLNAMFAEFNATVGREKGVEVRGVFYSTPANLVRDLLDAARSVVGSRHMPDMFCSYPNNALRIDKFSPLLNLETVFTPEERAAFVTAFQEYGTVNGKWLLMPVSKSTEALYLNKTDWEPFAAATGCTLEDLRTWEGVVRVAAAYNAWTNAHTSVENDGHSFISIDYPFHFLLMTAMQLERPLFVKHENSFRVHIDTEVARRVWEAAHVPYLKGYYRNDFGYTVYNVAQGVNIGGITSTAFGGMLFPATVTRPDAKSYPIECLVLPYPVFEGGVPFAPLRGGQDIAVVQGDAVRQAGCMEFLRWFSEPNRNLNFSVPLGYLPIKKEALAPNKAFPLSASLKKTAAEASLRAAWNMASTHTLYDCEPFTGNVELEEFFDRALPAKVTAALETLKRRVAAGEPRETVLAELIAPAAFERWHAELVQEAEHVLANAKNEQNNEQNNNQNNQNNESE